MKKINLTMFMALFAVTIFAQNSDEVKFTFDFNTNRWGYPVTTAMTSRALPDYEDGTGAITQETDFPWPIAEGSDKNVIITVYPVDPDEYNKPVLYAYCEENNDGVIGIEHPKYNMLFTNPGASMSFKAPEGYKFAKMLFYFYKSSYFLLDTEEEVEIEREGTIHKDKYYIWIPSTPKINKNDLDCWEGDETNIMFNAGRNFKGNFKKIDITLVSDGSAGIHAVDNELTNNHSAFDLQGRRVNSQFEKGVYISNGKKHIVK